MVTYAAVFGFMVIAFLFMGVSLHFAQYKRGAAGGTGRSVGGDHGISPCGPCPKRDAKGCGV
ncbi:MAG: hypothetical protein IIC50_23105 [Planctomycetes bacterium]|nr:hypothetical protein [Planctomycetota bacterium]